MPPTEPNCTVPAITIPAHDSGYTMPEYRFLFAVNVTTDGGSAGDQATACTFTYAVTDLAGNALLAGASPVWNRTALGKMIAATSGTAYLTAGGTAVLYQVDEVFDVAECPS